MSADAQLQSQIEAATVYEQDYVPVLFAPFAPARHRGSAIGAGQQWGVVVGGSLSQRRFDSELFRGADGAFANFNGYLVPQTTGMLIYDVDRRR